MFRILIGIVGIFFAVGFMSVPFVFPVLLKSRTVIGSAVIGAFCLLLPTAAFMPRLRRFAVFMLSAGVTLTYAAYLVTALYAVVRSPRNFPPHADDLFGALCGSLFIGYPAARIAWHCVRGGDPPSGLPPFGGVIQKKLLGELPERKTRPGSRARERVRGSAVRGVKRRAATRRRRTTTDMPR